MTRLKVSLKDETVYSGNFARLKTTQFVGHDGGDRKWEWIDKSDIVFTLPITREKKIILVKVYRIPVRSYVLETPAGTIEAQKLAKGLAEQCAQKELIEETGYFSNEFHELPVSPISSGISGNYAHGFIAINCEIKGTQQLESAEDIEVNLLSLDEIITRYIENRPDCLIDPRIIGYCRIAERLGFL